MNWRDDDTKNDAWDESFRKTQKLILGWMIFVGVILTLSIGGVAWLVYVLLKHFGIM